MFKQKSSRFPSLYHLGVFLICLVSSVTAGWAQSAESDQFKAVRLTKSACCPAQLNFEITDKATNTSKTLTLSGRLTEIDEVSIQFGQTLVVEGKLPYGGKNLLLADLATGEPLTNIWTYGFSFSPSGRYLVYRTHYPRHGMPAARRSIMMLYDLSISPAENRFLSKAANRRLKSGIPIYPEEQALNPVADPAVTNDRFWVSPFLWSADETEIVFFECKTDWDACPLVRIASTDWFEQPAISRQDIDFRPFIRREGPFAFTGNDEDPVKLLVDSMKWEDSETPRGAEVRLLVLYPEQEASLSPEIKIPL